MHGAGLCIEKLAQFLAVLSFLASLHAWHAHSSLALLAHFPQAAPQMHIDDSKRSGEGDGIAKEPADSPEKGELNVHIVPSIHGSGMLRPVSTPNLIFLVRYLKQRS